MSKLKIKLIILGHLPIQLDKNKILNWQSDLIEIGNTIDVYSIEDDADGEDWEFSDQNILKHLPEDFDQDILIAMTHVPLEGNYYARRFPKNRVCMTFYEMVDILEQKHIPLENLVLRLVYSYYLIYKRHGNRIPLQTKDTDFTHDETRGCLFDMNGIKSDVIHSTNEPIVCDSCVDKLKKERVAENHITTLQNEIKKIRKTRYYRISDFIQEHPILTLVISVLSALVIGIISSILATLIIGK